jgi:hypothetical protein
MSRRGDLVVMLQQCAASLLCCDCFTACLREQELESTGHGFLRVWTRSQLTLMLVASQISYFLQKDASRDSYARRPEQTNLPQCGHRPVQNV